MYGIQKESKWRLHDGFIKQIQRRSQKFTKWGGEFEKFLCGNSGEVADFLDFS